MFMHVRMYSKRCRSFARGTQDHRFRYMNLNFYFGSLKLLWLKLYPAISDAMKYISFKWIAVRVKTHAVIENSLDFHMWLCGLRLRGKLLLHFFNFFYLHLYGFGCVLHRLEVGLLAGIENVKPN